MSKRMLIILAYLSFAFNVAFVGMFIYHRFYVFGVHERLPNCDSPEIERIRERYKMERKFIQPKKMEFDEQKKEFIERLKQENFDEKKLLKQLNIAIKKQMEMEKEIGLRLIKLRKQMTPEEAKYFFGRMHGFHPNDPFSRLFNRRKFIRRKK